MKILQEERKVTLTVSLLRTKLRSKKNPGKESTRGYYLNVPQCTVHDLGLLPKELVELTIKRTGRKETVEIGSRQ
jgi:hypothetical protein